MRLMIIDIGREKGPTKLITPSHIQLASTVCSNICITSHYIFDSIHVQHQLFVDPLSQTKIVDTLQDYTSPEVLEIYPFVRLQESRKGYARNRLEIFGGEKKKTKKKKMKTIKLFPSLKEKISMGRNCMNLYSTNSFPSIISQGKVYSSYVCHSMQCPIQIKKGFVR